ncbi:MAG TPA: SDR family oxidoreductase [Bacteroidota bacterium]|nr:SDR family oxidoreductase [Bacteroidota bacterium]
MIGESKMVILITGASKGIGYAIARHYTELGHSVYGISRTASEIADSNYQHYEASVDDEEKVHSAIRAIKRKSGRLDVLINNAGVASMNHSLLTTTDTLKQIFSTNVYGTFICSREAAKLMIRAKYGRIINITTFAVPFKLEGEAVYAASKAAVDSLTHIMAREYAEWNITVNAIAPPAVKTNLIAGVDEKKLKKLLERQAIHKYGVPEDVINTIDFLIRPSSGMVTGQTIYLGGV